MHDDEPATAPPSRAPSSNSSLPYTNTDGIDPRHLQKVREWQQDRIERRLRGEYESYVQRMSQVVEGNLDTTMHIKSVRVDGADATRPSFLQSLIKPLISTSATHPAFDEKQNLEYVLHTTRALTHRLHETDIFKSIDVRLERSSEPPGHDHDRDGIDVDIVFKVREKGRLYLKTATEIGNEGTNASVTGHVRNVFGGAETLEAHLSLGAKLGDRSFSALLTSPISSDLQTRAEVSAFGTKRDNTSYASSEEKLWGIRALVRNGMLHTGLHSFTYEAVLRCISGLTPSASISIREAAGRTSKSSLSYTWVRDTRDHRIAATRGYYTRLYHELAGLGGDASFYKTQAEGQLSRALIPGVTVSFAAQAGFLYPFGGQPSFFSDRFQYGGPMNVRAFRTNGLGPRDGLDSLGGDLYWGIGISLISDIPRKPDWPVKSHLYVNAGRLNALNKSCSVKDNVVDCISRPSLSAGIGLIYRFDPIRVELNFGVPLIASKSDRLMRGLQAGLGLELL